GQSTRGKKDGDQPKYNASSNQFERMSCNKLQYISALSAESHAYPNFLATLIYVGRKDTVDADGSEDQSRNTKRSKEPSRRALCRQRFTDNLIHCNYSVDGLV